MCCLHTLEKYVKRLMFVNCIWFFRHFAWCHHSYDVCLVLSNVWLVLSLVVPSTDRLGAMNRACNAVYVAYVGLVLFSVYLNVESDKISGVLYRETRKFKYKFTSCCLEDCCVVKYDASSPVEVYRRFRPSCHPINRIVYVRPEMGYTD